MSTINGDLYISGVCRPAGIIPPAACIVDSNIALPAAAASGVQTSKLNHRQHITYNQAEGSPVVTETRQVWIVNGAVGNLNSFKAQLKVANIGAATVTVDLKKNGTSVLSAPISFSSTDAALAIKTATITTAGGVVNDLYEEVITATAGGGTLGQGLYADGIIDEFPS